MPSNYQQFVERNARYLRPEPMADLEEARRLAKQIVEPGADMPALLGRLAAANAHLVAAGWAPVRVGAEDGT